MVLNDREDARINDIPKWGVNAQWHKDFSQENQLERKGSAMPEGINRLVELVLKTRSLAIIEMGYFKFRECLIRYDKERLSKEMIASFSKIHKVRNTTARYLTYSRIASAFNDEIEKIKQLHLEYLRDKLAGREV